VQQPAAESARHGPDRRQAVVIIHGVGDQRPMQTLRAFVEGVIGGGPRGEPRFFSKPDRVSETLELRRLSCWPPHVPSQTDFYELYWAHLMEGTSWQHVAAWFRMLLFRNPRSATWAIRVLWMVCWAAIVGVFAYYLRHDLPSAASVGKYGLPGIVAFAVARSLVGSFGLHYVGDAARYLSPTPSNIAARKAIRNSALELLRTLHDEAPMRYDRIVVVGHSLGSVIAYDALSYLWQERHSRLEPVDAPPGPAAQPRLDDIRRASVAIEQAGGAAAPEPLVSAYLKLQRPLLDEQRKLGVRWRITDLITLGCPLAHAAFVIASDRTAFEQMTFERMLPTSPPQLEDRRDEGRLVVRSLDFPLRGRDSPVMILHHAAHFACTRWTNLYFAGDVIGGALRGLFGPGVRDVRLKSTRLGGLWAWLPVSHVGYWRQDDGEARRALLKALDLRDDESVVSTPANGEVSTAQE